MAYKKVVYVGGNMSGYDEWRDAEPAEIVFEREDVEKDSDGWKTYSYEEVYEKVDEHERYATFAFRENRNKHLIEAT